MQSAGYISHGVQRVVLAADLALPPERAQERSVFHVEPLKIGRLHYWLSQRMIVTRFPDGRVETIDNLFPRALAIVREQLRSADNFPANAPKVYPVGAPADDRDEYIAQLGWEGIHELAGAILDQTFVTDAEKNA